MIYLAGKTLDVTKCSSNDSNNCNLLWLVIAAAIDRNCFTAFSCCSLFKFDIADDNSVCHVVIFSLSLFG